jgi:hypothetical protein
MSSALINTLSWRAGTLCCRASRGRRSETFVTAGPRSWVVICTGATGADIASKYSTRVVIAAAPSAKPRPAPSGSPNGRRSCCRSPISTSYSHFRSRSAAWHFRIRDRSTPSCFRPLPKLCSPSPPILRGWVQYFAIGHSSRCFSSIRDWVEKKIRRHLARACKRRGFGWKRWSREGLYGELGLFSKYRVSYRQTISAVAPV